MEFNVFEHFKDYKRTIDGPVTPEAHRRSRYSLQHRRERSSQ